MIKFLGIVICVLLFNTIANAKKIIINCKGESLAKKHDIFYIIDTEKKTLRTNDEEDINNEINEVKISDAEILMNKVKSKITPNGYNVRLIRFDRYSGYLVSYNVYINYYEFQNLQSQIALSSSVEMKTNWIEIAANKAYESNSNNNNKFHGTYCRSY